MSDNLVIWDKIFRNNEWGKYPPLALVRFIARNFYNIPDRKEAKMLELGTGPGANLWYLAREGFMVSGIEGSETACDQTLQRLKDEHLDKNIDSIKVGDYYELLNDYDDCYFDAIVDVESLYCNTFEKSRQIVKLSFDKLKPGGMMLSITFADGTWGMCGDEIDYHAVSPTTGVMEGKGFSRYTTREDIEKLYKLNNNQLCKVERQDLHLSNGESIKEWIIELKKS